MLTFLLQCTYRTFSCVDLLEIKQHFILDLFLFHLIRFGLEHGYLRSDYYRWIGMKKGRELGEISVLSLRSGQSARRCCSAQSVS